MTEPIGSDRGRRRVLGGAFLAFTILLGGCERSAPPSMSVWFACSSESGDQLVLGHLDLVESKGSFRLQFFGQDVFYSAKQISHDNGSAKGTAIFESSLTGETKAAPFDFVYDRDANKLSLDGVWHECDTLQDRSLVSLPMKGPQSVTSAEQQSEEP